MQIYVNNEEKMNKNVDGGGAFGSIMSIECVHPI